MIASAEPPERRSGRQRLTRTGIITTAIELIDGRGLPALTLRALAVRLQADPSALYRHFRNKDDLLAAVADTVLQEIGAAEPDDDEDWRAAVRKVARRLRDVVRRRPGLAVVVASAPVTDSTVAATTAVLHVLTTQVRLTSEQAEQAFATILAYVLGASLLEGAAPDAAQASNPAAADDGPRMVRDIWFPTEAARDERFERGLDMLVSAIAAQTPPRRA